MATPAPMTPRLQVLKALNTTLPAQRFQRPIKGVFVTDSIGLYGATKLENSMVSLLQVWFDEQWPTTGVPAPVNGIPNFLHFSADYAVGFPYPMYYEPGRVGVPGKMSAGYGDGFGQQANVQGPGSARFKKTKQTTGGVFLKFTKSSDVARILVDGVLRKTVTAAPVGQWVEYRIDGFGSVTEPEVRVEFVTGSIRYDGQAAYRGNETKGFQMWDSGHSGYGTNQMTDEGPAGSAEFMDIFGVGLSGAPDFVYISLGTNDGGYSAAVFLDKRRNLVKAIRKRYPKTIIIDVMLQEPSPFGAGVWDGFIAGSHQLASEFANYIVFDFSKFIAKQSKGNSGFMYDSLHPNDAGYRRMRDVFVNYYMGVVDLGIPIPAPAEPGTGTTPPPTTTVPVPSSDANGPALTYQLPAANAAFAATASVTFEFDAVDDSEIATIGVFGQAGQGIGIPKLVTGSTTRYRLVAAPEKLAGVTSWRVSARDSEGNLTVGPLRSIAIAAAAAPSTAKPVIQITTAAGREVRDEWVVNANITHPDGIQSAVVYGQGSGKSVMIGDMVKGQGDTWSALILPADVPAGTNRFSVIALSAEPSAISAGSPEVPVTILSASDQTAPTAAMTSPVADSVITLDGDLVLRTLAIDTESGVKTVEFLSDAQILPFAVGSNLGSNVWGRTVPASEVPRGTTKVRARVKDAAGNETITGAVSVTLQVPTDELWLTLSPDDLLPLNPRVRARWVEWLGGAGGPVSGDSGLLSRDTDGRLIDTQTKN